MKLEAAQFLLEITDHERHRLIEALDQPSDRSLVEELHSLQPCRGLVIKAPSADAAQELKVVSSQSGAAFPVFCVCGEGAGNRTKLEVTIAPEKVAEIARALQRDNALSSLIGAMRQAADHIEARMHEARDDELSTLIQAHIEHCKVMLRSLGTPANRASHKKEEDWLASGSRHVEVDGLLFA